MPCIMFQVRLDINWKRKVLVERRASDNTQIRRGGGRAFNCCPLPPCPGLRHSRQPNAMRSGRHPLMADAIVGHGYRKKDVKSLYLTINDADLVREIDRLTFDHGKTEIWGQE